MFFIKKILCFDIVYFQEIVHQVITVTPVSTCNIQMVLTLVTATSVQSVTSVQTVAPPIHHVRMEPTPTTPDTLSVHCVKKVGKKRG